MRKRNGNLEERGCGLSEEGFFFLSVALEGKDKNRFFYLFPFLPGILKSFPFSLSLSLMTELGETYSQLGDATMEVLSSKYRLGDGQRIDNRERHQALDQEMQLFGVLTDDLRLSMKRQAKTETFQLMDMVQEYRSMLQGLKVRKKTSCAPLYSLSVVLLFPN